MKLTHSKLCEVAALPALKAERMALVSIAKSLKKKEADK